MKDIYFKESYASLYEDMEQGTTELWELDCEYGKISYLFIKRPIPIETDQQYFDIITPYGYGGPIVLETTDLEQLNTRFQEEFTKYCVDNAIVSEFVRFHPVVGNAKDLEAVYHPIYMRQTVGTTVDPNGDTLMLEFNQTARKLTRKAERQGVTYRVTPAPKQLNDFLSIYYATMDRNKADSFYYFEPSYFEACLKTLQDELLLIEVLLEDKVIAACIYFVSGGVLHEHLMGSLTEYLSYSPVYVLKAAAIEWATENGINLIHYGGGLTNAEDDPLFLFKKKFTRETLFDFYIAKKIHQSEVYEKLCQLKGISIDEPFFPAYRK